MSCHMHCSEGKVLSQTAVCSTLMWAGMWLLIVKTWRQSSQAAPEVCLVVSPRPTILLDHMPPQVIQATECLATHVAVKAVTICFLIMLHCILSAAAAV